MKRRLKILSIVIGIVLFLIVPIKRECNDGGTVEYSAILYKVIKWNRIRQYEENKTGTEVYFFPQNLHSLEYYDFPRPDAIAIYNGDDFVVANIGTYQWSKTVDGITSHINACALGAIDMEYKDTLKIKQGESIEIQGLIANPTEIKTYQNHKEIETQLKYDETIKKIDLDELDKGIYIIELFVEQGVNKVCYSFKIEIVGAEDVL